MPKRTAKDLYEWDIFFSYPRREQIRLWVAQVLHPEVERALGVVGLGSVRIFRDELELEAGDVWPADLSKAHARSRVVLAVLCFPYFESRWCCSEWKSASQRVGDEASRRVLIPVRYNDTDPASISELPPWWRNDVAKRQVLDLRAYTPLVNARATTVLAERFRREIAQFCESVLKPAILGAPRWNKDWPQLPTKPVITTRPAFRSRFDSGNGK